MGLQIIGQHRLAKPRAEQRARDELGAGAGIITVIEQQAIADLLGEQDAAIAALEEKREKYARIKDGMMRDMLTGKVRI